jgi:hypothetical protein
MNYKNPAGNLKSKNYPLESIFLPKKSEQTKALVQFSLLPIVILLIYLPVQTTRKCQSPVFWIVKLKIKTLKNHFYSNATSDKMLD